MRPIDLARFPLASARALRQLISGLRAYRPDVVHVQCFSANGVYSALVATLFRVPLVVTLQGETVMDDHDVYGRSFAMRLGLRVGLHKAAVVTGCSRFVLEDAERRFGLRPGAGRVVPNGVEAAQPEEPARVAVPFDRFVFALGRFVPNKGFDLLLEAFAEMAASVPDVGLVVGGDGVARAPFWKRVQELDLIVGRLDIRAFAPDVFSEALYDDPHCVVAGRRHPLLGRSRTGWQDAARYPWVLPPAGTPLRRVIDATFVGRGLPPPQAWVESASLTTKAAWCHWPSAGSTAPEL